MLKICSLKNIDKSGPVKRPELSRRNCGSGSRGFSFVEISFAIICLGFLISPIFRMLNQSSSGTVQNRNDILAQQHATNLLANAYSLPYDHPFLTPGPARAVKNLEVPANGTVCDISVTEDVYLRTIEVFEQAPVNWPHAYKILTVRVKWKEASESAREIKIAGLVTK